MGDANAEFERLGWPTELIWVVRQLFEPAPSPVHVKAKSVNHEGVRGPDGFFDTIKNYSGVDRDRVQRAWVASCGSDTAKIMDALANPKKALPKQFIAKWEVALKAAFGESYKFEKRTHLTDEMITGQHVRCLRVKSGVASHVPTHTSFSLPPRVPRAPRAPRVPPSSPFAPPPPRVPRAPPVLPASALASCSPSLPTCLTLSIGTSPGAGGSNDPPGLPMPDGGDLAPLAAGH